MVVSEDLVVPLEGRQEIQERARLVSGLRVSGRRGREWEVLKQNQNVPSVGAIKEQKEGRVNEKGEE